MLIHGNPPIVKCKWETPDDGDPTHIAPGTQTLPPVAFDVTKPIGYYAVVTDPEGVGTVSAVYADVFHPQGPPENGSFKYQIQLFPCGTIAEGLAQFDQAIAEGLITFASGFTPEDVRHQLEQGLAVVYCACGIIHYHQPAGDYRVEAYAFDRNNNQSVRLINLFTYIPVTACEFDFATVNYGSVEVCVNKWVGGDTTFALGDGLPTVRNIGNTNAQITVFQDDMSFGKTMDVWNVEFDIRLGATGQNVVYNPAYAEGAPIPNPTVSVVPDVLSLCNTQKLDFSIHVKKAPAGAYNGTMTIGCIYAPF